MIIVSLSVPVNAADIKFLPTFGPVRETFRRNLQFSSISSRKRKGRPVRVFLSQGQSSAPRAVSTQSTMFFFCFVSSFTSSPSSVPSPT